jgi:hypothetical protein
MPDLTLTDLRAEFQAVIDSLHVNRGAGDDLDYVIPFYRMSNLPAGLDELDRSIAWTQQDDAEVRALILRATDNSTNGHTVTATLTVDELAGQGNNPRAMAGQTVATSCTSINGTEDVRVDLRTTTGTRVRLLKGVTYRLTVETTGTILAIQALLQVRAVRRGADRFALPVLPHAFRGNGNLDSEKLNENLQALADESAIAIRRRYTYCPIVFPLDGITDTDAAVLRQFAIRAPTSGRATAICGVEFVVASGDPCTWTLTHSESSPFPTVELTAAGVNSEQYAGAIVDIKVDDAADTVLTLTANTSAGNQIDRGYLVVWLRSDRYAQGTAPTYYEAPRFDAGDTITALTVGDELTAAQAVIDADLAVDEDFRAITFVVRNLVANDKNTYNIPVGANLDPWRAHVYVVANALAVPTVTVDDQGVGGSVVISPTPSGVAARAFSETALNEDAGTDPMDDAQDITVEINNPLGSPATLLLMYVTIWFR